MARPCAPASPLPGPPGDTHREHPAPRAPSPRPTLATPDPEAGWGLVRQGAACADPAAPSRPVPELMEPECPQWTPAAHGAARQSWRGQPGCPGCGWPEGDAWAVPKHHVGLRDVPCARDPEASGPVHARPCALSLPPRGGPGGPAPAASRARRSPLGPCTSRAVLPAMGDGATGCPEPTSWDLSHSPSRRGEGGAGQSPQAPPPPLLDPVGRLRASGRLGFVFLMGTLRSVGGQPWHGTSGGLGTEE